MKPSTVDPSARNQVGDGAGAAVSRVAAEADRRDIDADSPSDIVARDAERPVAVDRRRHLGLLDAGNAVDADGQRSARRNVHGAPDAPAGRGIEGQDRGRGLGRIGVGERDDGAEERAGGAFRQEPLLRAARVRAGGELLRVGGAVGIEIGGGIGGGEQGLPAVVQAVVVGVEHVGQVDDVDVADTVSVGAASGPRAASRQ